MYPINFGEETVGNATIDREGLYCKFRCVCSMKEHGRYHIILHGEGKTVDLGLCIPEENAFVLRTSIPAKYKPCGQLRFEIQDLSVNNHFIPVTAHHAFPRLIQLKAARLVHTSGQLFVKLYPAPSQQGSGQNQEYLNKSVRQ